MFPRKNRYVDSYDSSFLSEYKMEHRWTLRDELQFRRISKAIKFAKDENNNKVFIYTIRPAVKRKLQYLGCTVYRSLGTYWTIQWK